MYPKETATTIANSESKIDLVITSQNYTLENIGIINKHLTILADKLGILLPPAEPMEDLNLRDRTVFDMFREKSWEHNYLLRRMLNTVEYINDTIENRLDKPKEITLCENDWLYKIEVK